VDWTLTAQETKRFGAARGRSPWKQRSAPIRPEEHICCTGISSSVDVIGTYQK
jgi:hypothetical protein